MTLKMLYMISGLSSCGKTHFIKNYIKDNIKLFKGIKNNYKYLIVLKDAIDKNSCIDIRKYDVIEYNLLKPFVVNKIPYNEDDPYGKDSFLKYIFYNNLKKYNLNVIILVPYYELLLDRMKKKYRENHYRRKFLLDIYKKKSSVINFYKKWLSKLNDKNIKYTLLNAKKYNVISKIEDVLK